MYDALLAEVAAIDDSHLESVAFLEDGKHPPSAI